MPAAWQVCHRGPVPDSGGGRPGSELRYRNPLVDEHTLLVVVSQSGETADTIAAMKECKPVGPVLAIVNVVGSTIAKLADDVLYTWAGPEIAVATTKGYTTQVAVLDLLAVYLARRLGRLDDQRYRALVKALSSSQPGAAGHRPQPNLPAGGEVPRIQ